MLCDELGLFWNMLLKAQKKFDWKIKSESILKKGFLVFDFLFVQFKRYLVKTEVEVLCVRDPK